jgi:hypothetical protein
MNHRFYTIVNSLLILLVVGCGTTRETVDAQTVPARKMEQGERAPLSVFESTLKPSDYDETVTPVVRVAPPDEEAEPLLRRDSVIVELIPAQGFRIQLFASSHIDEANSMRLAASQIITDDSLYVVFDPPVYKVRVGDFTTRLEANRKLSTIAPRGFPDAWVVADRIVQRKIVPVRREEKQEE